MTNDQVILVIYTTKYRLGGNQFPVVARTIADERVDTGFGGDVITRAVESKRDVLQAIAAHVVRYPRWRLGMAEAIFEILVAIFFYQPYPTHYAGTVPYLV